MENMNLHIQLFNQEIMNESSYIMEADGNKNFIQKAIDFIKETAKRFWKWLTTKVSEAKEKIMKFLKRKKQEASNNDKKDDNSNNDKVIECDLWDVAFSTSDLLTSVSQKFDNDFLNSDEVVNFTKEKYIENHFNPKNLNNKSAMELTTDDMISITKIKKDNKNEILRVIDNLEKELHDTTTIKKDYDKLVSGLLKSLESYSKCLSQAEQNPNAYSGVSLKRDNIDMETSSDYATTTKFKVGNMIKMFQLDNQIIMHILSTKLSAIVKSIDHDTSLLA